MKRNIFLLALCFIFQSEIFAQCFSPGGKGDFEMANLSWPVWVGTNTDGSTIDVTSAEKYSGNQSLHANIQSDHEWQNRIMGQGECSFSKTAGETFTVSFYAKGDVGNTMRVAIANGFAGDETSQIVTIQSEGWNFYIVSLQAVTTSSDGVIQLAFQNSGNYYVDELWLNEYDCNSDLGGSAYLDACGVCAEGATGKTASETCDLVRVEANNPKFAFNGVLETEYTDGKLSMYRFKKSYIDDAAVATYYKAAPASATSGVIIKFNTASPQIKLYFDKDWPDDEFDMPKATYDVFKNGELVSSHLFEGAETMEFTLTNPSAELTEWQIAMPTLEKFRFLGMDIVDGYTLETVAEDDRPLLVSIGDSQTQGVGVYESTTILGYPYLVADALDYQLHNLGISGSATYSGVIENIEGHLDPRIITVMWGYNDVHYFGDWWFQNRTFVQYEQLMTDLATKFPDACIMAILPNFSLSPEVVTPGVRSRTILRANQTEIVERLQLSYPNLYLMNGLDYTDAAGVSFDEVHINQAGNQSLANGILSELSASTCGLTVSSNEVEKQNLTVYPNPTNGIINFNETKFIEIYDVAGKMIFGGKTNVFDLSNFEDGLYIIKSANSINKILKK